MDPQGRPSAGSTGGEDTDQKCATATLLWIFLLYSLRALRSTNPKNAAINELIVLCVVVDLHRLGAAYTTSRTNTITRHRARLRAGAVA